METVHTSEQARLFKIEIQVLKNFCKETPSKITETVLGLVEAEDWQGLVDLEVNPSDYGPADVDRFRIDYQAVSMLKKSQSVPLMVDKRQKALVKFHAAEEQCREANERILSWGQNPGDDSWLVDVVAEAQHLISHILGPLDEEALNYAQRHCRFGPGSTGSVKRRPTQGRKFDNPRPLASPRLAEFLKPLIPALWADRLVKVECRSYIGITTVPKNAKTDRTIGIEPDLNIYVQLGIGALIRHRLNLFGVNLAKQSDRNAFLASVAHLWGLSTIDLSSASDCVSRSLVELLLPEEWRHLLRLARSDYYELDGSIRPFNKWSSMGNGYTFELETLIFMALARACGDRRAVAYGDDIIIKRKCAPLLLRTLDFLGFSVNGEKTFIDGLFFESCGTDWFNGVNVRPFFLKGKTDEDQPENQHARFLATLYTYANSISAAAHRAGHYTHRDRRYFSSWRGVFKTAPPSYRFRVPAGFNTSGGFECDWDECSNLNSATSFSYLRFVPSRGFVKGDWGPFLAWFSSREAAEPIRPLTVREDLSGFLVRHKRSETSAIRRLSRVANLERLAVDLASQELDSGSYQKDSPSF